VQGFNLRGPNFNIALGGEKFLELLSLMDEGDCDVSKKDLEY